MNCTNFNKLMASAIEYDLYYTVTKDDFGKNNLTFMQDKCLNDLGKDIFVIDSNNRQIAKKLQNEKDWKSLAIPRNYVGPNYIDTNQTFPMGGRKSRRHKKRKTKMRRYKHRKSRRTRR